MEGKISPRYDSNGQELAMKDVGAEMHVMVAVYTVRSSSIKSLKLIELRGHYMAK
ncbi:MAG: hypothetical protein PVS2B2_10240 [Candidatus Acidiferrum sp.]